MKKYLALLLIFSLNTFALEVDEKLTVRVLRTSESRKTVMLNRGIEDGIAEGVHAKFLMTAGIVARGVCVKVSPTRSIWSIYRLVNADFLVNDAVMTIKGTPPVKITKDPSQALVQEDTPTTPAANPENLGIPLAEGAQDIEVGANNLSNEDLKALVDNDVAGSLVERNKEIYSFLNVSALSASNTNDRDETFSSSQSNYHVGVGGEYYSQRERAWYSTFSLLASFAAIREEVQGYNGTAVSNSANEFSLGANWHPFKLPSSINEFIPYFHLAYHFGSINSTVRPGSNVTETEDISADGTLSGYSLGFGYKYYTLRGFGARILLDYYSRMEKYNEDDLTIVHEKTVAGPRLMVGLSYRF